MRAILLLWVGQAQSAAGYVSSVAAEDTAAGATLSAATLIPLGLFISGIIATVAATWWLANDRRGTLDRIARIEESAKRDREGMTQRLERIEQAVEQIQLALGASGRSSAFRQA